ncbi:MAG: hypothetical protein A3I04_08180 [Nitrospinae bacterium RIFCSPLOWO2_02_FULL_39_110]|nr:MAG: hypothetical protein A3I04_08180 [Nitrospinae bacterium RIFCSPLOWO2_02_FULL_39_110]OGW12055.1 MAG: hypothetical protein A3F81_01170 [Nitrospinae bacterium RIFCSPLOWO2_12_FULL_39_93]HLA48185.1 hypothetical protein [Nitrospinota bacterium]
MEVTLVQHESLPDGVADASFAQYPVTPTSSDADKANVTVVDVVDAAPLSMEIDGLDGAVVSEELNVILSFATVDIRSAASLNQT